MYTATIFIITLYDYGERFFFHSFTMKNENNKTFIFLTWVRTNKFYTKEPVSRLSFALFVRFAYNFSLNFSFVFGSPFRRTHTALCHTNIIRQAPNQMRREKKNIHFFTCA